jgi:hypothetical protein
MSFVSDMKVRYSISSQGNTVIPESTIYLYKVVAKADSTREIIIAAESMILSELLDSIKNKYENLEVQIIEMEITPEAGMTFVITREK